MREIPRPVRRRMLPMPAGFAPILEESPKLIAWRGRVRLETEGRSEMVELEYGVAHDRGVTMRDEVRAMAWTLTELARLGRADLIAFARVDRHAGRTVPTPA